MKKTVIALAVAGFAAASVAQAAPQANTFYVGAKAGWSSIRHLGSEGDRGFNSQDAKRNSAAYGVFAGYQIIDNLAVEIGYDHFGTAHWNTGAKRDKFSNHGAHFSLKPSYEVVNGLDVFARVGAALVRSDLSDTTLEAGKYQTHSFKVSPLVAAGVEYLIPGTDIAASLEYQWISRVGKDHKLMGSNDSDASPDIGSVLFGLSYRFGQGAAPVVAPEVVNKTFTLNSDVTFAFGKSNLKPEAASALDGISAEIAQVAQPQVNVAGYTDRIGKEAPNLKLSQKRAESVANYLVSKGVAAESITATGYGKTNPVTGNTCDAVKGRKALIACLAPDRRVEIQVQGSKQATM